MQTLMNIVIDPNFSCERISDLINKYEWALQTIEFEESALKIADIIDALVVTRRLAKFVKNMTTNDIQKNYTEGMFH